MTVESHRESHQVQHPPGQARFHRPGQSQAYAPRCRFLAVPVIRPARLNRITLPSPEAPYGFRIGGTLRKHPGPGPMTDKRQGLTRDRSGPTMKMKVALLRARYEVGADPIPA